jgi:hypothetical protein
VVLDNASGVGCSELRDIGAMVVVINIGRPGEGRVDKAWQRKAHLSGRPSPTNFPQYISRCMRLATNDPVTSQVFLDDCKTCVDAEWPLFAGDLNRSRVNLATGRNYPKAIIWISGWTIRCTNI